MAVAQAAARSAGVHVREIHEVTELHKVCELFHRTWSPRDEDPLTTVSMLRALAHVGNYIAGAFVDGQLVGAAVGFRGDRGGGELLHSHIAAVAPELRGRSVGFALKLHQRSWSLQHGIPIVTWTFDPLVSRNAYFNLTKLGAGLAAYMPSFYGIMSDQINAGDETDRVLVEWRLDSPRVVQACTGRHESWEVRALRAGGAVIGLGEDAAHRPVHRDSAGQIVLVKVPPDVERLRRESRDAAHAWRRAVREMLGGLMAEGASVIGFAKDGWYVVER
ncbi:GNAT family N-acetyltransferase [Kribbella turkmenica]|uniref:GNAT family N-acetyltransferase n=1 Tax=Kribbella turkmenica TaxID=2530375 RepID=A0A4R4WMW0_9ACTN|nr:GNAT family N-acetyltransferase [Kribbella turkmenica]